MCTARCDRSEGGVCMCSGNCCDCAVLGDDMLLMEEKRGNAGGVMSGSETDTGAGLRPVWISQCSMLGYFARKMRRLHSSVSVKEVLAVCEGKGQGRRKGMKVGKRGLD